ncbi:MAG: TraR/DksA family transcriptional regulator, partial [Sediminibacterium sp.]|nr:TraR/DksA family transcriptional regulator [Sediminibacterium sp.]
PIIEKKPKIIPPIKKIVHKEEVVKIAKLPKLSTEKSIPYNPSYTPLDKREFVYEKNQNIVRYSDNELQEFKAIIYDKMETAKKELAFLQGFISRKEEMGDDGETGRYITIEDGGAGIERERLSEMAARQIKFIDQLEKALIRIENKSYGVCRVTGKLISKERLRLVPHATLSVDAKLGLVK